ncbi:MAG: hypothetical protein QXW69_07405 [Nitrososphaerota archaeon]
MVPYIHTLIIIHILIRFVFNFFINLKIIIESEILVPYDEIDIINGKIENKIELAKK